MVRPRWQQTFRRPLRLHCAHPLLTSRSLRPIPITGPASISAAISALVLIALAAQQTRLAARSGTTTNTSFLGGGQVGVNYEFWSFFVIGAEAMFDWLPNTQNTVNVTNTTITPGTTNTAAVTLNNRWVTMATGKLGYAWDRVLLYGKGGGAWVGTSSPGLTVNNVPASFTSTSNNNNFGATVGLGVEWAFAGNWSARAEWDAILLQNQSFTVSGSAFGTDTITVNNRSINMFTAALNYKFGGWGY